MGRYANRRAFEQMKRDGIVRNKRGMFPLCAEVIHDDPVTIRCGKRAGYSTPAGHRCFTHALANSSIPKES